VATTKKTTKKKSVPKTTTQWVNTEQSQLPDRGEDGWYSLRLLLDFYLPGVLATAIEKHGIYRNDRHGRTIHCSLKENTEHYEQALDLLADWQAELDDPSPEYSFDSERYDDGSHPTEQWRLPDNIVKALVDISKGLPSPLGAEDQPYWTKRPLQEFKKEISKEGSLTAAAKLHKVSRQRYSDVYNEMKNASGTKPWPGEN
jgi:hypothetical protein